ncbi:MAG: hypothetical protein AAGA66_03550 [Bacteroidota bacterium]
MNNRKKTGRNTNESAGRAGKSIDDPDLQKDILNAIYIPNSELIIDLNGVPVRQ